MSGSTDTARGALVTSKANSRAGSSRRTVRVIGVSAVSMRTGMPSE